MNASKHRAAGGLGILRDLAESIPVSSTERARRRPA